MKTSKHIKSSALPFALLLFCVTHAPAQAQTPTPDPALPSLFVVGDSTANNNANGARGWGDPFVRLFDAKKINVVNRARAGRSSRTFLTEGLWDRVLQDVKRGDFVLIQFGHNDGGPLDTGRARGSLPGLGEETKEITKPDGTKEVVHTFGWYNRRFIADVRAKGATPIILSLTVRNIWKDGKVERGSGKFRGWAEELARSESVAFVDLTNLVADRYESLGQEKAREFFGPDHTHTSPAGAELNAALVAEGLKGLKGNPLGKYFK
ncbi:MAG TPA: rhamnogalacturonan acetylesterase [Pyrinomonadaceae bacterium]|nr:rhamnogalacturonan acetylesterase [Pyrinomonadaceae bacterium]